MLNRSPAGPLQAGVRRLLLVWFDLSDDVVEVRITAVFACQGIAILVVSSESFVRSRPANLRNVFLVAGILNLVPTLEVICTGGVENERLWPSTAIALGTALGIGPAI